jgi:DNA-binding CsgD family transcriptional regulator
MVDVLAAAAGGETACQTAARLGLSIHTIRAELRASRIRLDVPTITAAAVLAARRGLV